MNIKKTLEKIFTEIYSKSRHIAALEIPILEILIKEPAGLDRNTIIEQLKGYGKFERGALSFDHMWSQRFAKGKEKGLLSELIEHDSNRSGARKNYYKIKEKYIKDVKSFLQESDYDINKLINKRLQYVSGNLNEFEKICECLNKNIGKDKIELTTKIGTAIYLSKIKNGNYTITFKEGKGSSESITKDNLYKFLFEEWKGSLNLDREDGRISYFEAIDVYIKSQCKKLNGSKNNKNINMSLNQILYGPPGTGKTYHTIDKALEIIDGNVPESREEAKARFEVLKEAGQIEFVTFHQSYGYEEFVEGIKAKSTDNGITYTIESGIFKKISDKSLFYMTFSNYILNNLGKIIFGRLKIIDIQNDEIYVDRSGQGTEEVLYIDKFFMIHESFYKFLYESKIKNPNKKINFHYKLYAEKILDDNKHDVWLYAKLYDSYISQKNLMTNIKKPRNYILIIDEINRGNISKIFGELITLIEESKRLGNDEAMEVTLPYSGEKFGVPKNLYILGTMNTADRSIALMDTALRRRFEFEEMMPKPELLGNVEDIDLKQLLVTINKRIEYLYDRDHTIGHAYFMGITDKSSLDSVMKNKVIPLLQEYFYDDWEKIQIVLGDHKEQGKEEHDKFVRSVQNNEKDILGFNYDELDEEEYSYIINETFTDEAYLKIYE